MSESQPIEWRSVNSPKKLRSNYLAFQTLLWAVVAFVVAGAFIARNRCDCESSRALDWMLIALIVGSMAGFSWWVARSFKVALSLEYSELGLRRQLSRGLTVVRWEEVTGVSVGGFRTLQLSTPSGLVVLSQSTAADWESLVRTLLERAPSSATP